MTTHKGSCLCGAVGFEIKGDVRDVIYCHCHQCRKQTGHIVAATWCLDEQITISGDDNLTWYTSSDYAKRGFCKHCGSQMFWKKHGSDEISILAGSFDEPTGLKASHHIFVADKGDYYDISDGLPQSQQAD